MEGTSYQRCGPVCDDVVQTLPIGTIGDTFGAPAYFNGQIYYQGAGDVMRAFPLVDGMLTEGSQSSSTFGFPGSTPSISANGSDDAIVWTLQVDAFATSDPAILHAYAATDLAIELYASNQAGVRDQLDGAVKFTTPTVANGHVYVGTQTSLAVFGLFPDAASTPSTAQVSAVAGSSRHALPASPRIPRTPAQDFRSRR